MQEGTNSQEELSTTPPHVTISLKGIKYTIDGEAVEYTDGSIVYPPAIDIGIPTGFNVHHNDAMVKIHRFIQSMPDLVPNRKLPALRSEIIEYGVSKRSLKELEEFGFIQIRLIAINDIFNGGKPVGARAVVYFTPTGKGYFKHKEENTNG